MPWLTNNYPTLSKTDSFVWSNMTQIKAAGHEFQFKMQIIVHTLMYSLLRKGQLSKVDSVLLQNRHRLKHPQKAKYFHVDLCPRTFQRQPLDIF